MQWVVAVVLAPSHLNEILLEGGVLQTCHDKTIKKRHGDIFHHSLRRKVHANVYILGNTEVDYDTSSSRIGLAT